MEEKDIIKMTVGELKRLHVIEKILDKRLKQREAAVLLNLSERQIRRIVKRVRSEGDKGIAHKGRGRKSNRCLPEQMKRKALSIYKETYKDFGPTFACEKLEEMNGIKVSRETLRKWLIDEELWKRKRKPRKHRTWRPRKECRGEMVLFDGSHHDWLEGRGKEEMVLMAFVDDASGDAFGYFYDYEGTLPALDCLKRYIKAYGIPLKIYLDRHSTYLLNRKLTLEEELEGIKNPLTQFQRACSELSIEIIHANSPQAKGRIEREFSTLQDRLVKELRLHDIKNQKDANDFLPGFFKRLNHKFSVTPAKDADFHREIPKGTDLEKILCVKEKRILRNDSTIAYKRALYLVEEKIPGRTVIVEERTDGSIYLNYKGNSLSYKRIGKQPKAKEQKPKNMVIEHKTTKPAQGHPWRRFNINPRTKIDRKEECLLASK